MCANPKIIYLLYPEQEILELRSMEDLDKVKRVPLKLPVAAMGCSPDTTETFKPKALPTAEAPRLNACS